jgi:RNA-directed DNA polymerase
MEMASSSNKQKLRVRGPHQSQEVTGLTVNRIVNVKRRFIREIRAMLHAWERYGLEAAERVYRESFATKQRLSSQPPPFAKIVAGKLSFLSSIRGKDDSTYLRLLKHANSLDASFKMPPQSAAIKTSDELLKAIWVLECDQGGPQGTAFMLSGFGLVTCHHVLTSATHAFQPSEPSL